MGRSAHERFRLEFQTGFHQENRRRHFVHPLRAVQAAEKGRCSAIEFASQLSIGRRSIGHVCYLIHLPSDVDASRQSSSRSRRQVRATSSIHGLGHVDAASAAFGIEDCLSIYENDHESAL